MRVRAGQLALWSLLMATAHGAALMLLPFLHRPVRGAAGQRAGPASSTTRT